MPIINNIPLWNNNQHRDLEYTIDFFKDQEQLNQWKSAGHNVDLMSFNAHRPGKLYDWCAHLPQYFNNVRDLKFCFHQIPPGHYLPSHIDRYDFFKSINNIDNTASIRRYIVFLEDRKDGHFLTIENNVYANWRAGDTVAWTGDAKHSAINLGLENRYTLQVTGLI